MAILMRDKPESTLIMEKLEECIGGCYEKRINLNTNVIV